MCQTFLLQESEADPGWLNRREVYFEDVGTAEDKLKNSLRMMPRAFPGGTVVENLPANAGDTGSSPGLGRSHMPRSN